jgi:hypothetical protein
LKKLMLLDKTQAQSIKMALCISDGRFLNRTGLASITEMDNQG